MNYVNKQLMDKSNKDDEQNSLALIAWISGNVIVTDVRGCQ